MPPDVPLVMLCQSDLQKMLDDTVTRALDAQQRRQDALRRVPTAEAAGILGCSSYHLQRLHKRGLPYEKGKPNFYKLSDLEEFRETRKLVA